MKWIGNIPPMPQVKKTIIDHEGEATIEQSIEILKTLDGLSYESERINKCIEIIAEALTHRIIVVEMGEK